MSDWMRSPAQMAVLQQDFKGYMWEPEWQKYQSIAVVDGIGMSIRYAGVLLTNSVAVKQTSPFYEYFYRWLTPMEDFVPVEYSLKDLPAQVEWLQRHPAEARRIAESSSRRMQALYTLDEMMCYLARLLEGVRAQTSTSQWRSWRGVCVHCTCERMLAADGVNEC